MTASDCNHEFHFDIEVHGFSDRQPLAQVQIRGHCTKCNAALEFIGMECGINLNGPAVSPDQREARLAAKITTEPASIKFAGARFQFS